MNKFKVGDLVKIREDIDLILNLSAKDNQGYSIKDINMNNLRGHQGVITEVYENGYSGNKYYIEGIQYSIPEGNLNLVLNNEFLEELDIAMDKSMSNLTKEESISYEKVLARNFKPINSIDDRFAETLECLEENCPNTMREIKKLSLKTKTPDEIREEIEKLKDNLNTCSGVNGKNYTKGMLIALKWVLGE